MHRLLAIFLALLALLPPPALLAAGGAQACGNDGACETECLCCEAGACHCAESEKVPPREPAVPVRGAELYPVTALPPAEIEWRGVSPAEERASVRLVRAVETMRGQRVPLFVRHCAWLR
jgi:hypothetical protein